MWSSFVLQVTMLGPEWVSRISGRGGRDMAINKGKILWCAPAQNQRKLGRPTRVFGKMGSHHEVSSSEVCNTCDNL